MGEGAYICIVFEDDEIYSCLTNRAFLEYEDKCP